MSTGSSHNMQRPFLLSALYYSLPFRLPPQPKCQGSNFARRVACYMCNAARPAHPQFVANEETQKEEASTVLAVRGLDTLTTETTLYTVFASFGAVKEIRLIRDKHTNVSRGFCFVEYYTLEETKYALENSIQLRIDGQLVRCSFARGNEREGPPFKKGRKREERTGGPQHVANAALEQAQWAIQNQGAGQLPFYHQPVSTQTAVKPAGLDTSSVGQSGVGANLVAFPVPEGFEFDQSSGYYYSAQTGYYYDSTTGYYYDSSSGTYYYYDVTSQSYVVVDNTTTPTPSSSISTSTSGSTTPATSTTLAMETSSATTGVDTSTDSKISFSIQVPAIGQQTEKTTQGKAKKPKTKTIRAKKVSKELERWNKKNMELQQQLEEEQQQREPKLKFQLSAVNTATPAADGPARAEIGESGAGTAHQTQNEDIKGTVGSHDTVSQTVSPLGVASSSSMLDLGQLFGSICLLCRRKFASPDAMAEHVDRSKLHQQNLEIAREKEVKQLKELTKQQNMLRAKAESQKERKKKRKRKDETILPTTSATAMAVNSLGDTNIGNQMLRKMGWEAGKGLGKDGDGITAPIQVTQRAERAGLGAPSQNPEYTIEAGDSYQKAALKKARARLDALMG
ncbi:RNA-binding protein 5 [Balamuthia mandrillaris]